MSQPCLHCFEREAQSGSLCSICSGYPKCKGCEVIFGEGLSKPSKEDPTRCDSCLNYETKIAFYCANPLCSKPLELFYHKTLVLRYFVRGNFCSDCNVLVVRRAREARPRNREEFTDYLAIMYVELKEGRTDQESFDFAARQNPQDIASWVAKKHYLLQKKEIEQLIEE